MFRRGFKSSCEQTSLKLRRALGLKPTAPVDPIAIAAVMGVPILGPDDLPDLEAAVSTRLKNDHSSAWSALTVSSGNDHLIVLNPNHTSGRTNSNLAHEISHLLLGHEPSNMYMAQSELSLRTFNKEQEDEANWLAGCILLPREALLLARQLHRSDEQIVAEYGVSIPMLRFRINATGVDAHLKRAQAYRR